MKKVLLCLMSILLLAGLAGCSTKETDEAPGQTETSVPPASAIVPTDIYLPRPADERLAVAAKQNRDAVAWLSIEGTSIDDVVLQSADNDYYLRRDAYGEYSMEGCYFADYESKLELSAELSQNVVVYGHTFQDDPERRFFAQLTRYTEDEAWAMEHRYIQFSVSDAMLTYEVISAGEVDATDSMPITATMSVDELNALAGTAIERSVFDFGADAATCGQLLTLSTCTGDYSTRLLVVARLISQ